MPEPIRTNVMPATRRRRGWCRGQCRALVSCALALIGTSCASFESATGEPALFAEAGSCKALAAWVDPLRERHGERPRGLTEIQLRERASFLFTDPYFVPIFGTPVDRMSDRQFATVFGALKKVRKRCDDEPYLQSILPDIFLAKPFDPKPGRFDTFTREHVVAFAVRARGGGTRSASTSPGVGRATVRRAQRLLTDAGFDVGKIDGLAGSRTAEAVVGYKRRERLSPVDGAITPALIAHLERAAGSVASRPSSVAPDVRSSEPARPAPRTASPDPEPARSNPEPARTTPRTTSRTTAPALTGDAATRRIDGTPDAFVDDMRQLLAGRSITLSSTNMPFLAGVSAGVLKNCDVPGSFDDRTELTKFVASSSVGALAGTAYSDPDLRRSLGSMAKSQTLLGAGEKVGGRIGCGNLAEKVTSGVLRSVRDTSSGPDGGPTPFVSSCTGSFSRSQCQCLADAGRSVMPDIHQQRYQRSVVPTIIQRNPFVGMQIMMTCGISNY